MPTRAELAAELRLFASMLRRHDDPEAQAEAERLEVSARLIERHGLLPDRDQSGTYKAMVPAARANISTGRSRKSSDELRRLVAMASKKGHTLRSLAKLAEAETGLRVPHNIVSRALNGTRPIRKSVAEVIAKVTGYRATDANWPGGFSEE